MFAVKVSGDGQGRRSCQPVMTSSWTRAPGASREELCPRDRDLGDFELLYIAITLYQERL